MQAETLRANGGHARAAKLTAEERSAVAAKGAAARWADVPAVLCGSADSPLKIGDAEISCYVLDDERRVLTQGSVLLAMGRHRNAPKASGVDVPPVLSAANLQPYISDELRAKAQPITFRLPGGGRARGYDAHILPAMCEVYLDARAADVLLPVQMEIARRAEILMRGFAQVGIIALVDEATGYQSLRRSRALAAILEAIIDKEYRPWVKMFPEDYYLQIARLRSIEVDIENRRLPPYFGHLTNDIVYSRLAPGVLDELKATVERDTRGRPKRRFHQHLTDNIGVRMLHDHLVRLVTIMRLSRDWDDFYAKLQEHHPVMGMDVLPIDWDPIYQSSLPPRR